MSRCELADRPGHITAYGSSGCTGTQVKQQHTVLMDSAHKQNRLDMFCLAHVLWFHRLLVFLRQITTLTRPNVTGQYLL
jgi:hypothetical protein